MKIFAMIFFLKMVPLSRGKSPTENRLKEMKQKRDGLDSKLKKYFQVHKCSLVTVILYFNNTSYPYRADLPAAIGGASYKYFRHWSWYSFHFCTTPERDPSVL